MKKLILALLILCLLLPGCAAQQKQPNEVAFYYPMNQMDYSVGTSYLQCEMRSKAMTGEIMSDILNQYLQGPMDKSTYAMPFPQNAKVYAIIIENGIMDITLTGEFATYTGIQLTIACACIAKTGIGLTGVDGVRIRAYQTTLDGMEYIEMNDASVLLVDNTARNEE